MTRAHAGPGRQTPKKGRKSKQAKDARRVVARTKATAPPTEAAPSPVEPKNEPSPEVPEEDEEALAEVISAGALRPA
ncbi:hypothetical protein [Streptomyces sp. NPDC101181]|uniref:hypothetical protein n=1 Tax=Streptomyces sp. NPDC101181 TaxID=3366125 RepID=UPI0037F4F57C